MQCYYCHILVEQSVLLTAVLGAGRFDELACWTADSGVKQPPVIWVDVNLSGDFLLCHCACEDVKVM